MAETYVIKIGDLPSRKLRKRVRGFLKGDDVSLISDDGQTFGVVLKRNQLVIAQDEKGK
jgi:hypothetical protein